MKCNQSRRGFELESPCLFPTTITTTPRAPPLPGIGGGFLLNIGLEISWWVSLKHRIRDFASKYGRQLTLDRTRETKSIDDRLSRAVAGGTP